MTISKKESTKATISPTTTLSNHQKEAILNAKTTKGSMTSNWPSPSAPPLRAPSPLFLYPRFDHSSASLASSSSTHSPAAAVPQFHTFPREMRQLPPKRPPPPQQLLRADTLPNTLSNQTNAAIPSAKLLTQLKHSARMACCFCCCPVYRCVLWFCAFELICSIYFWYSQLSDLMRTYSNAELKDVLGLLILSGWLVTLAVSTASILIAHRKGDPQWVLPRLVQQSGLLILGFMMALLLVIYFAGGAQAINNWLITIYEGLYSDPIPRETRQGVQEDLRFYFLLSIVLTFCFICYISSALCATKKYYRELQITGGGRPFQPVSQMAPPPQPPVNPYYKGSYA